MYQNNCIDECPQDFIPINGECIFVPKQTEIKQITETFYQTETIDQIITDSIPETKEEITQINSYEYSSSNEKDFITDKDKFKSKSKITIKLIKVISIFVCEILLIFLVIIIIVVIVKKEKKNYNVSLISQS